MTALDLAPPLVAVAFDIPDGCATTISTAVSVDVHPITKPIVHYPETLPLDVTADDIPFLLELVSDPTIAWYDPLAGGPGDPRAVERLAAYVQKARDSSSGVAGWIVSEGDRHVGACQLRRQDEGLVVGVSLCPTVRGRGLGTALFQALAYFGLNHLDAAFVAGEVEDDNIASLRALHNADYVAVDRYEICLDNGRQTPVTRFVAQQARDAASSP